jgi:hypothetical protein
MLGPIDRAGPEIGTSVNRDQHSRFYLLTETDSTPKRRVLIEVFN